MPRHNVYIVNASNDYRNLFLNNGFAVVSTIDQADLVCFTGGSDVSPHLYNERKHPYTCSVEARDFAEKLIFLNCVEKDIPMVGICRGGQFLNVMNGGKMYQHVERHAVSRGHAAKDVETGEIIHVTSTHHQMMRPAENGIIVTVADEGGIKEHMNGEEVVRAEEHELDVEAVFYPHTSSLCFQPHPEFYGQQKLAEYFFTLISRYISLKEFA